LGKKKPKSPEQIAAEKLAARQQDFQAAGLDAETATLAVYADVQVARKGQKYGKTFAWRSNVFRLLLERKTIDKGQFNAAQQLIQDWAEWRGLDGRPELGGGYVDNGSTPGAQRCPITNRMERAGHRLFGHEDRLGVFEQLANDNVALLRAFMVATVEEDRPMSWRGIVQRTLGVSKGDLTLPSGEKVERQAQAVVEALEALRSVYEQPRRAAA
jgi:hypothetical protein